MNKQKNYKNFVELHGCRPAKLYYLLLCIQTEDTIYFGPQFPKLCNVDTELTGTYSLSEIHCSYKPHPTGGFFYQKHRHSEL